MTIGRSYQHKLTGNLRLTDITQAVGTKNWTIAKDILDTLNAFMSSAVFRILYTHFARADTGKVLTTKQTQYISQVVEGAEFVWSKMTNPEDPFPTVHDCYLKQYQLGMPNLSRRYTTILFDEAQDSNPVTSSIVLQQHCKVILVGDRHQQIYRFRGANNALDSKDLAGADQLYLTHSWRFGRNVAIVANALLELKGETLPVKEPDCEWLMIDASHIKLHPHASGARGGNQDMGSLRGRTARSIWHSTDMKCH